MYTSLFFFTLALYIFHLFFSSYISHYVSFWRFVHTLRLSEISMGNPPPRLPSRFNETPNSLRWVHSNHSIQSLGRFHSLIHRPHLRPIYINSSQIPFVIVILHILTNLIFASTRTILSLATVEHNYAYVECDRMILGERQRVNIYSHTYVYVRT